ncbi:hypothetical protein ACVSQB_14465 [Bradyrhizobium elkanii]
MLATPIYIICSPSPQVGKTLVARLVSEYLLLKNGTALSFDVNLKEPSLLDYLPNITETADVIDTYGKMQLMDPLIIHDRVAKVIDLGFHAFDEFFKMCEEIGFIKETARCCVAPVILFVAGADRHSFRGYQMLRRQIPPAALVTVHNEFVLRGGLPEAMDCERVLRISALPLFLKRYVDRLSFSFTGYLRDEKDWTTELHQWIRRNYTMFRDLESCAMQRGSYRSRATNIESLRGTRATEGPAHYPFRYQR